MEYLTVPNGVHPLSHRAQAIGTYGAYAFDMLCTEWICPSCRQAVAGPESMILPLTCYRSLGEVANMVVDATRAALSHEDALPSCPRCRGTARLVHADYHLYSSWLRRDLVVRFSAHGEGFVSYHTWSAETGFAVLPDPDESLEHSVRGDALFRDARSLKDEESYDRMVAVLEETVATFPEDPKLIDFLPCLCKLGVWDLAMAMADAHVRAHQDTPEGYYWCAQIIVENVAACRWSTEALKEAESLLDRACSLRPDYPDAEIALANIARIRGQETEAEKKLHSLLMRHPKHPEANYTLGLVLAETNPEAALQCLSLGERYSPADSDYPRSLAKLLLDLGRKEEALQAAMRAKQLAPNDSRIDSILAAAKKAVEKPDGRSGSIGAGKENDVNCLTCGGELELGTGGMYARCKSCFALFMNMNNTLTPYPVDESTRSAIEQALGFAPSKVEKVEVPKSCTQCQGELEVVQKDNETITRCKKCGLLSRLQGAFLVPIIVNAPSGGWDPEFQAIFEEQLGFKKRVRKRPPGVV